MNFEPNFQILLCRCCANSVKENCSQLIISQLQFYFVALEGFEPSQAEPESDVLPLHHKAVFIFALGLFPFRGAKLQRLFRFSKYFRNFFQRKLIFPLFRGKSRGVNVFLRIDFRVLLILCTFVVNLVEMCIDSNQVVFLLFSYELYH